jgi:xylene monooxygenase electron transfer component
MFGLFTPKGPFRALIESSGKSFQVEEKDNLLKAALGAGLRWPHNCRVGSCGTCRARLVHGKIKPLQDFSYVLSAEELDQGYILACQSRLRSDVVVEVDLQVGEAAGAVVKSASGVIESCTRLTHDILEVRIRLTEPMPAYVAGQYADVLVSGMSAARSYSFARAPSEGEADEAAFFVRHVPGGQFTDWLHAGDRSGERVTLSGPYGQFWLRESDRPVLLIAGGSGLAPIRAILKEACKRNCQRQIIFLFGARTQRDLYCIEDIEEIRSQLNGRFHFVPVLSHEPGESDWRGARGMVTEFVHKQGLDLAACEVYLCGPPPMIDAAIDVLKNSGVADEQIFFDKFLDASHIPGGRK